MSLGRKNAIVFGAALVAVAAWFVVEGILGLKLVDRVKEARPVDMPVDFSKPGDVTADFRQLSSDAHFQALLLELPGREADNVSALVRPLRLECTISDTEGFPIRTRTFTGEPDMHTRWTQWRPTPIVIPLVAVPPPARGNYRLTVHVTEGSPALAGLPQRLVMRYEICGLEYLSPQIDIFLGIVLGLIGGVILFFALRRRSRFPAPA
jgi:hypothetical protein